MVKSRSRIETNFIRLVGKCEELSMNLDIDSNNGNNNNTAAADDNKWRLEKYTESLEQMLNDLRTGPNQPDRETLSEYNKRVNFIKDVIRTSKLPTLSERVLASQQMKPGSSTQLGSNSTSGLEENVGLGRNSMEIKQRHKTKYLEEERNELFGTSRNDSTTSALSSSKEGDTKPEELDELLKFHRKVQENIADHMLDLTRSLKEQVSLAGQIIKKDTEVLEGSGRILDTNQSNLKTESERLEGFNKRACKCWVWFMLVIVCSTFVVMVLFMRMFKKRVSP